MRTLVIYATRFGSTARSAALIAQTLKEGHGVEAQAVDARRARRKLLESSDSFVLGSSIMMGRWKGSARRLLRRLAGTGKPIAVFVTAAGMLSGRNPDDPPDAPVTSTIEEREAQAIARYVDAVLPGAGLHPAAVAAFGGRMVMFGKELVSNWDGERVKAWAERLPEILSAGKAAS